MTKKSIKALKKIESYSPEKKALAGAIGVAVFPLALTLGCYKAWDKKHNRKGKHRRR